MLEPSKGDNVDSELDSGEDEDDETDRCIDSTTSLVSNIRPVSTDLLAGTRLVSNYFEEAESLNRGEYPNAPQPFRTFSVASLAFHLTRDTSFKQMSVDDAAIMFQLPDLCPALADYLQWVKTSQVPDLLIGGRRVSVLGCKLLFDKLQVWSRIRIQTKSVHHPHEINLLQTLNVCPPNNQWPHGRYDKVLVNINREFSWPKSRLKGNTPFKDYN